MTQAGSHPQPSALRRALIHFSTRSPVGQPDIDYVMRALVEHDDWYVPVLFADQAWGQGNFERMLLFPDAQPTPVLHVFSDYESAKLADGQALGPYGGPVSGVRLVRSLNPRLSAFMVNPASPREQQWYIAPAGFEIAVGWANSIAAERALAQQGGGPAPISELLASPYLLLIDRSTGAPANVHLPDIAGAVAVCFTAPDRVDEYVAGLPPSVRPLAELRVTDGARVFSTISAMGVSGVVINAGSDDQTALTSHDLEILVNRAPS